MMRVLGVLVGAFGFFLSTLTFEASANESPVCAADELTLRFETGEAKGQKLGSSLQLLFKFHEQSCGSSVSLKNRVLTRPFSLFLRYEGKTVEVPSRCMKGWTFGPERVVAELSANGVAVKLMPKRKNDDGSISSWVIFLIDNKLDCSVPQYETGRN